MIEFEREVLRGLCEGEPMKWGAAVGAALEFLKGSGYVIGTTPTAAGRAYIKGWQDCQSRECPMCARMHGCECGAELAWSDEPKDGNEPEDQEWM